jgi:hypothetical protein
MQSIIEVRGVSDNAIAVFEKPDGIALVENFFYPRFSLVREREVYFCPSGQGKVR